MSKLNLKNFAKIKNSDFDIEDITVFAGKPSTGKSYIMKMMYGMDEAINKAHSDVKEVETLIKKLDILVLNKKEEIDNLANLNKQEKIDKIKELGKDIGLYAKQASLAEKITNSYNCDVNLSEEENGSIIYENILKSIFGDINQISNDFKIEYDGIILNFKNNNLNLKLISKKVNYSDSIIFVETPLILEFKRFINREQGKTPYHIESLLKILDKDYSFTDKEQNIFIKSFIEKSKAIINGNIEDSSDSFIYKTNDKNFDIINASSGIKSIGLLQYLVKNKALKKGSILFWEEPEVHLHPTWQLKMVDLFIELMNAGVKIVFSTHSPFMADYLNAKAQRNDFRQRVSFNLLSEENNIVTNTILKDENWDLLQDELMGSFKEIMWQYL